MLRTLPQQALEIAARNGRYEAEAWRVCKDGSRFLANVVIDALKDDGGQLIGFAKITRDITERVRAARELEEARIDLVKSRAQEALRRAQAELAHVARVTTLGELTASIAHEVNQPLTGIVAHAGTVCAGSPRSRRTSKRPARLSDLSSETASGWPRSSNVFVGSQKIATTRRCRSTSIRPLTRSSPWCSLNSQ